MAENQQVRLHYFEGTGRAEVIRLCLHLGGIQFEDVRYNGQSFGEKKATGYFKFGQVPVLEVNGKQFAESAALENWAAKQAGLYPADNLTALLCDEARNLLIDVFNKALPVIFEKDEAKKQELAKVYAEQTLPQYAGYAEKLLEENGTGFFAGNSLSVADLNWYVSMCMHKSGRVPGVTADVFNKFTRLHALFETINNNEKVKAWNQAHNQNY